MKLILKLINNVNDLPKVVAKSSYPSSRNSQALPIVTATSEKQETWFYRFKARLRVNKSNSNAERPGLC